MNSSTKNKRLNRGVYITENFPGPYKNKVGLGYITESMHTLYEPKLIYDESNLPYKIQLLTLYHKLHINNERMTYQEIENLFS